MLRIKLGFLACAPALKDSWRKGWGLWIFSISAFISFLGLLQERHWGHYRIFTGAAKSLWEGNSPYFDTFGTNLGFWFYSPSCGLFFFGPFLLLPTQWGIFAYVAISFVTFLAGLLTFLRTVLDLERTQWIPHRYFNWFWLLISFETMGAILATKLELVIIGLMLFVASWLIQGRMHFLSAVLMAMMINWKFQPLPVFGLMICALFFWRNGRLPALKFGAYFVLALIFWFTIPFVHLGVEGLLKISLEWQRSLSRSINEAWVVFEHLFKLPLRLSGRTVEYRNLQIFSLSAAIVLASIVSFWTYRGRKVLTGPEVRKWSISLALAWGCWYIVCLSPMSQGNAYVLYSPVLLLAIAVKSRFDRQMSSNWSRALVVSIVMNGFLTSILYSDMFGKTSRLFFNEYGVKPYGVSILMLCVTSYLFWLVGSPITEVRSNAPNDAPANSN